MRNVNAGDKFGRWTVTEAGFIDAISGNRISLCKCECGTERKVSNSDLARGKSVSCGCYRIDRITKAVKVEKKQPPPEYRVWVKMRMRCRNERYPQFKDYGGRGIRVCDRWNSSFEAFFSDMGSRPSPKHEIDRIDNDGNYEPGNCRWATRVEQQRNKRTNHFITVGEITQTVTEWSERSGIPRATIFTRIFNGWSEVDAVTVPVGSQHRWNPITKERKKGR